MPKIKSELKHKRLPPSRVSEGELDIITKKAEALHMAVTEYIRFVALNCDVKVKTKTPK